MIKAGEGEEAAGVDIGTVYTNRSRTDKGSNPKGRYDQQLARTDHVGCVEESGKEREVIDELVAADMHHYDADLKLLDVDLMFYLSVDGHEHIEAVLGVIQQDVIDATPPARFCYGLDRMPWKRFSDA